jgi:hypothetical protein
LNFQLKKRAAPGFGRPKLGRPFSLTGPHATGNHQPMAWPLQTLIQAAPEALGHEEKR